MGDLSEHFSRWEFACNDDCGFRTVDAGMLNILQFDIRDYYNKAVTIISGCRCLYWNTHEEGSDDSYHMKAMASDFIVKGVSPIAVYTHLNEKYPDRLGLGIYNTFVHMDPRPIRARWDMRS